jgi:sarcosine oxidase delta subunit
MRALDWVSGGRSRKLGLLFTAAWCGYCPAAKTAFTKVARAQGDGGGKWRFMIIDESACPDALENFDIDGFPTCVRVNSDSEYECVRVGELTAVGAKAKVMPLAARQAALNDHYKFVKCDEGLRTANVHHLAEEVWRHRGGFDAYSGVKRTLVDRKVPNVDHIAEVQILNVAWCSALHAAPVGMRTRASKDRLQQIVNGVENLNVTTFAINQAKKGPFSRLV